MIAERWYTLAVSYGLVHALVHGRVEARHVILGENRFNVLVRVRLLEAEIVHGVIEASWIEIGAEICLEENERKLCVNTTQ